MSYTVTKYPHGTFCWADVLSTDVAKTKAFLTGLFGWTFEDMPTPMGVNYTMFSKDGKEVAAASPMSPDMPAGMPSVWNNYISVDHVDEVLAKVEGLSGKVTMPAMDVMEAGRMGGIQDPTGATVMFWQPKQHIGAQLVNTVGAMCWNELYTRDLEQAKIFFSKLLGWTYETDEKSGYVTIHNNDRMNGGMFTMTPEMSQMPPMWMVYFTVQDLAESVAKVKAMGGQVYMEAKEIAVGKIATVADPTGAGMILIEMSVEPTPWEG